MNAKRLKSSFEILLSIWGSIIDTVDSKGSMGRKRTIFISFYHSQPLTYIHSLVDLVFTYI